MLPAGHPVNFLFLFLFLIFCRRAEEGKDFEAKQGTVTFMEGQESANITIQLLNDAIPETEESVFVYIISAMITNPAQTRPGKWFITVLGLVWVCLSTSSVLWLPILHRPDKLIDLQ